MLQEATGHAGLRGGQHGVCPRVQLPVGWGKTVLREAQAAREALTAKGGSQRECNDLRQEILMRSLSVCDNSAGLNYPTNLWCSFWSLVIGQDPSFNAECEISVQYNNYNYNYV